MLLLLVVVDYLCCRRFFCGVVVVVNYLISLCFCGFLVAEGVVRGFLAVVVVGFL